jgi:hypothetical protein
MSEFAFTVVLKVEDFTASSPEQAEEKLNRYLDRLAEVEDTDLRWGEVDWVAYQDGEVIQHLSQPI